MILRARFASLCLGGYRLRSLRRLFRDHEMAARWPRRRRWSLWTVAFCPGNNRDGPCAVEALAAA